MNDAVFDRKQEEKDEIELLESSFRGLTDNFYLIDKIGEGTFSCVYRAIDLLNPDRDREETPLVAVKRLHVTSSANRIANELEILATLRSSEYVSHLVTALRDEDQVLVVMDYKEHTDFRSFYRNCSKDLMRVYMRQLLMGLEFVHSHNIIHRDIKPTNFLFNMRTRTGVLADFGLAEINHSPRRCPCLQGGIAEKYPKLEKQGGMRISDTRPSKRANRAGTRGFRAPEVLFKCNSQTPKIDIWAAGVILLMFLARRFPYFNSTDDGEALVEITVLLGREAMQRCALLHGVAFEVEIPSIRDGEIDLAEILHPKMMTPELESARSLLLRLLDSDVRTRLTADRALCHPFFNETEHESTGPGLERVSGDQQAAFQSAEQ